MQGGENYNARRYYRRITLIYAHLLFEMKLSMLRGQNSNPMSNMGHHGSIFPLSVNVSETFGDIKFSFARAQTTSEVLLYFGDTFK